MGGVFFKHTPPLHDNPPPEFSTRTIKIFFGWGLHERPEQPDARFCVIRGFRFVGGRLDVLRVRTHERAPQGLFQSYGASV